MGRFKDLFIEKVPEERNFDEYECDDVGYEDNVNIVNVTQDNFIADVYDSNSLSDRSQSIFKIEEVINTLPKEMPTETKRNSVIGMLTVFGLTVDQVVEDGECRKEVVNSAFEKIKNQNESAISSNEAEIENRKLEIQAYEEDTADRKEIISNSDCVARQEIARIDALIKFIGEE